MRKLLIFLLSIVFAVVGAAPVSADTTKFYVGYTRVQATDHPIGGTSIWVNNDSMTKDTRCTAGIPYFSSDIRTGFITAGHCALAFGGGSDQAFYTGDNDVPIGLLYRGYWSDFKPDIAFVDSFISSLPRPYVYVSSDVDSSKRTARQVLPIVGKSSIKKDRRNYCIAGGYSGSYCGYHVVKLNVIEFEERQLIWVNNLVKLERKGRCVHTSGDSGGTVYVVKKNRAYVSGIMNLMDFNSTRKCTVFVTNISTIDKFFDGKVITHV